MRYTIRVEAYQVMDGAQATLWIREVGDTPLDGTDVKHRRAFTAVELDCTDPLDWARDVLVAAIEHL